MPRHYIKFIRDGLYEFRVSYGNNEFRIFFIYDGKVIVVLFNAFIRDGLYEFRVSYGNNELKEEYYETKGNQ